MGEETLSSPSLEKYILAMIEEGKMEEMLEKTNGKRTIPQIFFDKNHIGGYVELRELEKTDSLLKLLK